MKEQYLSSLNSYFTKGLKADEKKTLEAQKRTAEPFLKHLRKVLEDRINDKLLSSENEAKYEDPNWTLWQADSLGYRRALRELLKVL